MKKILKKALTQTKKKLITLQKKTILTKILKQNFTKKSGSWYKTHKEDPYVKKSKKQNFRSRAAFKLLEIHQKYNLLKKSQKKILDLGASPGSWSQVLQKSCEKDTKILGVDLNPINRLEFLENGPKIEFLKGDIQDRKIVKEILKYFGLEKIDLIISDISPNLTGNKSVDVNNILEMNIKVVEQCDFLLKKNGELLMKSFQSYLDEDLFFNLNLHFGKIIKIKPSSSRKESNEIFYLCKGYKKTFYWDLIKKKGDDLSYEELFREIEAETGFVMDKEAIDRMKYQLKVRFSEGNLKREDLRYKFQRDFFEDATKVEIDEGFKSVSLEDIKNNLEKFKKEFPDSEYLKKIEDLPETEKEFYEKVKKEGEIKKKEILHKYLKKENHLDEEQLLDIDQEIEKKREKIKKENKELNMNSDPFQIFFEEQENFKKQETDYKKNPKKFEKEQAEIKEKRLYYLKKYQKFLKKQNTEISKQQLDSKIEQIKQLITLNYKDKPNREKLFKYLNKIYNDKELAKNTINEQIKFEEFVEGEKKQEDFEETYGKGVDGVYKKLGKDERESDKKIKFVKDVKGEKGPKR